MRKEINFGKRWRLLGTSVALFLCVDALFIPQQMKFLRDGNFIEWMALQIILLSCGIPLCWHFIMQKFIRFYDDGISYVKFFKSCFLHWDEIIETENLDSTHYTPTILRSNKTDILIFLSEFERKAALRDFIKSKTLTSRSSQ